MRNAPSEHADLHALRLRATALRRHMLEMARGQGQGYIGQGLGIADLLAALYFHELRYDPQNLDWADRDRFLLSTGHYSIALWAALVEAGILPVVELSDGELQEGSTWEAAMSASHFKLDTLVALVDCNGIQADGPVVLDMEPVADKWRAFGWEVIEIDGNDMNAVIGALMLARTANGRP